MKKGFTLIELLVVIVIIAILAAVIFVALDPITRFKQARDSQRWNAVNNIMTALHECIVDNEGILADCDQDLADLAVDTEKELGTAAADCGAGCATGAVGCIDLSQGLLTYLAEMPTDPGGVVDLHTGYTIEKKANGIFYIRACHGEEQAYPDIYVAR